MTWNGSLGRLAMASVVAGLAWAANVAGCAVSCPEGQLEVDGRCEAAALHGDGGPNDGADGGTDGGPTDNDATTDTLGPIALRVQVGSERVRLRPGLTVEVPVEVTADPTNTAPIAIEVQGLPNGVSAGELSVPPGGSGALTLTATGNATPIGPLPITVRARRGDEADETEISLMLAGASGGPVTTFGTQGRVSVPLAMEIFLSPRLVAHQGGFIVAGRKPTDSTIPGVPILRYSETGALDTNFGTQGYATEASSSPLVAVFALANQGDQVLALGTQTSPTSGTNTTLYLRSFTAEGRAHAQFGTAGSTYVTSTMLSTPALVGVHVGARGIYVQLPNEIRGYRLVGAPNAAFGASGVLRIDGQNVTGMLPLPGEGILVVQPGEASNTGILRAFDATGMPVSDFGVAGRLSLPFAVFHLARWDATERLTFPASFGEGAAGVARIEAKGTLDESFGENGRVVLSDGFTDQVFATYPLPDGSTLTVSLAGLVRRLDPEGVVDPDFGVGGEINLGAAYVTSFVVDEERGILTFFAPSSFTTGATMILGRVWL